MYQSHDFLDPVVPVTTAAAVAVSSSEGIEGKVMYDHSNERRVYKGFHGEQEFEKMEVNRKDDTGMMMRGNDDINKEEKEKRTWWEQAHCRNYILIEE
jgi:hypothetical protein